MMRRLVAVSILTCCFGTASGEVVRDVPYMPEPNEEQYLDFYWPAEWAGAVVVFIHGGSLAESGERRSSPAYEGVCDRFMRAGIACATTDYRLSPSFRWPAMVEDVVRSIVRVRELVEERSAGRPYRLFLFGHSSGCQLAAVIGTNPRYLAEVGLSTSILAGIIPMGCTLDRNDLALRGAAAETIRETFARHRDVVELYGTPESYIAANPAHHIGPHVPPTLVVVAREERFFPSILEQGARFVRLLLENDVRADLVIVPGTHMSSIEAIGKPGDPTFEAVLGFIRSEVVSE